MCFRMVKVDPTKNASDVCAYANCAFDVKISRWIAQRILKRHKLFACRPARKPLLKECPRKSRLLFARTHLSWTPSQWGKILWSDESRFNLFNADGGIFVRRPPGKRYNQQYTKGTVKFSGGGIMVWGKAVQVLNCF